MPTHKSFDRNFFKKWSGEMAYVLGFLFADGNITKTARGGNYVSFYTMDRPLLAAIKETMGSEHMLAKRTSRSGNVYRIQIGSQELVSDLEKLGLIEGKTRRMQLPFVPVKQFPHFVRGFFDGDGNVWVGKTHLRRKTPMCVIQTAFTSASAGFLKSLHVRLREEGLSGGSIVVLSGNNCARLSFSIKDSLKLYEIMYNGSHAPLYLPRKKEVFERYMKMQS